MYVYAHTICMTVYASVHVCVHMCNCCALVGVFVPMCMCVEAKIRHVLFSLLLYILFLINPGGHVLRQYGLQPSRSMLLPLHHQC